MVAGQKGTAVGINPAKPRQVCETIVGIFGLIVTLIVNAVWQMIFH
jgi:hypothetical protein